MGLFPTSLLPKSLLPKVKPKDELEYILLSENDRELSTSTCESTDLGYEDEYSQYKKLIIESLINAFILYNTPINDKGGYRLLRANLLIDFPNRMKLLNHFNFEKYEPKIHYSTREADAKREADAEVNKNTARKKLKERHDGFIHELNELEESAFNMKCKNQYNLIQKVKNFGLTQFEILLPNLEKYLEQSAHRAAQQRAARATQPAAVINPTDDTRLINIYANMNGIINKDNSVNTNINLIEQSINSSIKDLEDEYFKKNNTLAMTVTGGRNYIGKTTKYIKIKRRPTKRRPIKRKANKKEDQ